MVTSLREEREWNATHCTAEKHREVVSLPIVRDSSWGSSASSNTAVSKKECVPMVTVFNRGRSTSHVHLSVPRFSWNFLFVLRAMFSHCSESPTHHHGIERQRSKSCVSTMQKDPSPTKSVSNFGNAVRTKECRCVSDLSPMRSSFSSSITSTSCVTWFHRSLGMHSEMMDGSVIVSISTSLQQSTKSTKYGMLFCSMRATSASISHPPSTPYYQQTGFQTTRRLPSAAAAGTTGAPPCRSDSA